MHRKVTIAYPIMHRLHSAYLMATNIKKIGRYLLSTTPKLQQVSNTLLWAVPIREQYLRVGTYPTQPNFLFEYLYSIIYTITAPP